MLNGNVTFGSGSTKDVTFNGSLASTIPVKTNNSVGIGSATLGLSGIYFGGTSSFTTRIIAAATASWTLTLPPTAGIANQIPVNSGAGVTTWQPYAGSPSKFNYTLTASVGSSNLTINLKSGAGSDPSATDPVTFSFRNATIATGDFSLVSATAATTIVIPSGATMGFTNGLARFIYVYAMNNAGTVELVVASKMLSELDLITSTTIDTAADSATGIYSTTGRSTKAIRYLGRVLSSQATAGTWASAPTEISVVDVPQPIKWQRKYLGTDLSANTADCTDLKFSNLIIGRTYRVSAQIKTNIASTSTRSVVLIAKNNSVDLAVWKASNAAGQETIFGSPVLFTAQATTLVFSLTVATADLIGGTSADTTWTMLEELPAHAEVADF